MLSQHAPRTIDYAGLGHRAGLRARRLALLLPALTVCACQEQAPHTTGTAAGPAAAALTGMTREETIQDTKRGSDAEARSTGRAAVGSMEAAELTTADNRVRGQYPLQDNPLAGCSLCHVDVEDEFVGCRHYRNKIGCRTCHGPSAGHLADENNEVKPDEVFARQEVDRLCGDCHECGRPDESGTGIGPGGQPTVCIDCHNHHTLALTQQADTTRKQARP